MKYKQLIKIIIVFLSMICFGMFRFNIFKFNNHKHFFSDIIIANNNVGMYICNNYNNYNEFFLLK